MHPELERTLRNLGVVSQLKQHDKLVTEGDFFAIYAPTAVRAAFRFLYGETRTQNMSRVADCIQLAKLIVAQIASEHNAAQQSSSEAVSISYRLQRREEVAACARLLKSLEACTQGLENLMITYRDDTATVVRIHQLKQNIADFLESANFVTGPRLNYVNESRLT